MDNKFSVYKWRREFLTENESNSEEGTWVDNPGVVMGKKYDGYFKPPGRKSYKDEDAIKAIEKKGYTYVDKDEIEKDARTIELFYYKK